MIKAIAYTIAVITNGNLAITTHSHYDGVDASNTKATLVYKKL